jgi:hypothetical protein
VTTSSLSLSGLSWYLNAVVSGLSRRVCAGKYVKKTQNQIELIVDFKRDTVD